MLQPKAHQPVLFASLLALLLWACGGDGELRRGATESCQQDSDCAIGMTCASGGYCTSAGVDAGLGHDAGVDAGGISDWDRWGTVGSLDGTPTSPDGHGFCSLEDIRTDDLGTYYEDQIPQSPWGSDAVGDDLGRCGDDFETTAWRLMNCERMTQDLEPLACDLRLVWLGRQHSRDMHQRDFFDHTNPDGHDPFDRMADRGISYGTAGENIAWYPTVESGHLGWMDSDGHRRNILSAHYGFGGIGVVREGNFYLTQLFVGR